MINLNKSEKEKLIGLLKKDGETKANLLLIKRLENSMKSIKPRSAKNKGLEWQKETCEIVSRITGIPYDQKNDDCEIHSRESEEKQKNVSRFVLSVKTQKLYRLPNG